jgi:serine/threonine protein kinase
MSHHLAQRWAALSPLLDELLDLDAAGRAARLAQCRASDARLADELAQLLAEQPVLDEEAFLEGAAPGVPPAAPTLAGQRFGAYMLVEPIGAGGMGSVWRARRSDGRFEGTVAVKLLNLALAAKGGAERFAREGQVLARLSHPNIAHLIDAGVSDGGQPFIVLEHVQGEPIDRHCEMHHLGVEARVRLLLQVMAAVEHAHGRLVLHRDLKPGNILVTPEGQIKLLDFGIAKLLDDSGGTAAAAALTQLAGRAFTPEFAAPEQVQGGEVTTATDVYALGVLMYVLLSGAHPTAKATDTPVDRLRSVVETEPPRLSDAAQREQPRRSQAQQTGRERGAGALRGDLDNIAAKALKKAPTERYASVAGFAADLQRWLADEPVSARADTWRYRTAKFVRRHRIGVAAASLTAASLIAGIVGTTWQAVEARRERDRALFEVKRANARANLMDLVLQATGDADKPVTQREILDRSVLLIDKQFADDPKLAVDLLYPIAGQYAGLGDSVKDLAVMKRAAEIAAGSGDAQLIAHVACNTVDAELGAGHIDAAQVQMDLALRTLAQVPSPGLLTQVECLRAQAEVSRARSQPDEAAVHLQRAVALMERQGDITGGAYGTLLSLLANVHRDRGDLQASWDVRQRRHELDRRLGRTDNHNHLSSRIGEAATLLAWGEVLAAQQIVETVAARFAATDPASPPPMWFAEAQGALLARLGHHERAEGLLRATVERARASGSGVYAQRAQASLVLVLIDRGQLDEANALLRPLETAPRSGYAGNRWLANVGARATLQLAQGQTAAAQQTIDAALAQAQDPQVKHSAAAAVLHCLAARAAMADQQLETALQRAREAVAVAERVARDPARSADVGEALLCLARAEQAAGRPAAETARRAGVALRAGLGEAHAVTRQALALASAP